jgi:hypothetical protein
MFLSSLLTCDICWVCRICFGPPCWHVTYVECVEYDFFLLVDMTSAYVTCQQGGQKHILHTQHMSHVNKEDKNIFYTLSICHVNKENKNIFYTLSICHMSSSLLTCDICWVCRIWFCPPCWHDISWVCRICFCPPCWHVTYTECVEYVFVLLVDMTYAECVEYVFVRHMSTRKTKTYATHSAYVTCQQGEQKHILHTQHMSHVNKEDKNIFYTLSICHMSTRRTKT